MAWREFKPCTWCGEEMLTWKPTQKFCSKACRGASERASRNYPVEEWANLYIAGTPYRQIAERYGVSYAVVRVSLNHHGVKPRTDHEHLRKYDAQNYARILRERRATREQSTEGIREAQS